MKNQVHANSESFFTEYLFDICISQTYLIR